MEEEQQEEDEKLLRRELEDLLLRQQQQQQRIVEADAELQRLTEQHQQLLAVLEKLQVGIGLQSQFPDRRGIH